MPLRDARVGVTMCEHGNTGTCGFCLWLDRGPNSDFWLAESCREDETADRTEDETA